MDCAPVECNYNGLGHVNFEPASNFTEESSPNGRGSRVAGRGSRVAGRGSRVSSRVLRVLKKSRAL